MTVVVVGGLVVLAACDGAFSGFRSSVGRSGLVDHRADDVRAQLRGLIVVALLLVPAAVLALAGPQDATEAGRGMLTVYAPYGVLVLAALLVYGTLGWRTRFLAMAVILGPFTLLRPVVAVAGGLGGVLLADHVTTRVAVALAVAAVLAVGPICDRLWYRPGPPAPTVQAGQA